VSYERPLSPPGAVVCVDNENGTGLAGDGSQGLVGHETRVIAQVNGKLRAAAFAACAVVCVDNENGTGLAGDGSQDLVGHGTKVIAQVNGHLRATALAAPAAVVCLGADGR
jgi:hypothetical protein